MDLPSLFADQTLDLSLRIPLSVLQFLEFAVWGAWYVVLGNYLNSLGFSRKDIGRIYATLPIGAIIAPMFVGTIADRYFAAELVMGVLHLLGVVLLLGMAMIRQPRPFFWVALLYGLAYSSTLPLAASLILQKLPDPTDYPHIAVLGTAGWIIANLSLRFFIKPGEQVNNRPLLLAAGLSLVLGIFSFFLPNTPPPASGIGAEATALMGVNSVKVAEGGSGYTTAPQVVIKGGGGSKAEGVAQVDQGKVVAVNITDAGTGYTSVPTVTLVGGGGSGASLQANLKIVAVEVRSPGTGYQGPPPISLVSEKGEDALVKAKLEGDGIGTIAVVKGGKDYEGVPRVAFPERGIPFLKALQLFEKPEAAAFLITSLVLAMALAFYYSFGALYFEQGAKVKPENVAPLTTIGQGVRTPLHAGAALAAEKLPRHEDGVDHWHCGVDHKVCGLRGQAAFAHHHPLWDSHSWILLCILLCGRGHEDQQPGGGGHQNQCPIPLRRSRLRRGHVGRDRSLRLPQPVLHPGSDRSADGCQDHRNQLDGLLARSLHRSPALPGCFYPVRQVRRMPGNKKGTALAQSRTRAVPQACPPNPACEVAAGKLYPRLRPTAISLSPPEPDSVDRPWGLSR